MKPHEAERTVREIVNEEWSLATRKQRLAVGANGPIHEFDLYQEEKLIAGITTSPWRNRSGTSNTGGKDRAAAELLWLSLWSGYERRAHISTDRTMAEGLLQRFRAAPFPAAIELYHVEPRARVAVHVGTLGVA